MVVLCLFGLRGLDMDGLAAPKLPSPMTRIRIRIPIPIPIANPESASLTAVTASPNLLDLFEHDCTN